MSNQEVQTCIQDRIQSLRAQMIKAGVQAYVVYHVDPHLAEYLPSHWLIRPWLSGFTGSAGHLIVTLDDAGVWTDSRYWNQAELELGGSGIKLMKSGSPNVPDMITWLCENLSAGQKVAVDANLMRLQDGQNFEQKLVDHKIELINLDLISSIWNDRPALPTNAVFEHLPPFAVRTRVQNLEQIRAVMQELGATHHLISSVDDVAWALNLRGSDVDYNPVFVSYLLLGMDSATLFVNPAKLDEILIQRLAEEGISVKPYEEAIATLDKLDSSSTLLLDPMRTTYAVGCKFPRTILERNPAVLLKALKREEEVAHVRRAMEHDGAALCNFFSKFEELLDRNAEVSELTVDEILSAERAKLPNYVSLSFPVIAGFNANGAMPHYRATPESFSQIKGDGLLLIDSGGQYLGGTTDITRMVPIGTLTEQQKLDCTLVLQGMIDLSLAQFPEGSSGRDLDMYARQHLWRQGLDYGHGTGHGVGYFMNVHEGPQGIAKSYQHAQMMAGMITSNEPGLYREGQWGVRIENLLYCIPAQTTEFGRFLKFETLTLCPIDTRCILLHKLSPEQKNWLNDYHAMVREKLTPLVHGASRDWLFTRTETV